MSSDLRQLFKRLTELTQPDLRKYYRVPRKGKIVASYISDGGTWYADVQPLRNDESDDTAEPVLPKLELPVTWGGVNRGIVCPPAVGTYCVIAYLDGDPSYPFIMSIRWYNQQPPQANLDELVIQQQEGVQIKIDQANKIITLTPSNVETTAGVDWTVQVGGNASITAGGSATIQAPQINLVGNVTSHGGAGGMSTTHEQTHRTHDGSYQLNGNQGVAGSVSISGNLTVGGVIKGKVAGCSGC